MFQETGHRERGISFSAASFDSQRPRASFAISVGRNGMRNNENVEARRDKGAARSRSHSSTGGVSSFCRVLRQTTVERSTLYRCSTVRNGVGLHSAIPHLETQRYAAAEEVDRQEFQNGCRRHAEQRLSCTRSALPVTTKHNYGYPFRIYYLPSNRAKLANTRSGTETKVLSHSTAVKHAYVNR